MPFMLRKESTLEASGITFGWLYVPNTFIVNFTRPFSSTLVVLAPVVLSPFDQDKNVSSTFRDAFFA